MLGSRKQRMVAKRSNRSRIRRPSPTGLRPDRDPSGHGSREGATLALLTDILLGEHEWTLAQVQRLVSLAEQSERGRWGADPTREGSSGDDAAPA